ncbi:uncharacterized protein LY89DRAFT_640693 [Mollisia scopiformis]|uniref:Uncharacterized protein n=1 Tax=Mollisia scopiformis TaxID=149040 RepID=A0A194XKS7_MOLSC|nr:uncharacterized protein LY89DRAFT_640693 [Mollisia scopiformis]KUJ20835.1 hypothetical protein LY89DRAFT_640693 [Mollisia scopiformis]
MASPEISLSWTGVFTVAPQNKTLPGDKILLPQSALEQLLSASTIIVSGANRPNAPAFDPFNPYSLAAARAEQSEWRDAQQQLPHPLTFRLVNTKNGNVVHAGIREFSADEGEVVLSSFLLEALGITEPTKSKAASREGSPNAPIDLTNDEPEEEPTRITIHAKQLPKGTYVRLRPLEAGYNPEDWKSLLERHLRENFTTLTKGEILTVRGSKSEEFRFLIDKFAPEGDGVCVVDTDLEVDIEALNEEQARETLKQIMAKAQKAPGAAEGSSVGGDLSIWKPNTGQVLDGDYVDYQLVSWDKTQGINIELFAEDRDNLELFMSPYSSRQRARPRDDEHVFGDFDNVSTKSITLQPSNVELENAEALYISVHAREDGTTPRPHKFSLAFKSVDKHLNGSAANPVSLDDDTEMHNPDEEQCKNCHQWAPKRTMMLHENFCLRNNILCPHCENVFQKKSQEWENHWHCPFDSTYGNTPGSKAAHDSIVHSSRQCPNCPYEATNLRDLASHRTSVTTDCHLCSKIIRLRDMATHLKHHELEKVNKSKPAICRNINCGRTLHGVGKSGEIGAGSRMGQGPGNDLGLCSICFGPLYVSMHDPEGKAMRRRVERRYISQVITGCGKKWCQNEYCKTAKARTGNGVSATTTLEAAPKVRHLMDSLPNKASPMYFCVDEGSQKRRGLAELIAAEKIYELEWCVAACEAETGHLDQARTWLQNWAPKRK